MQHAFRIFFCFFIVCYGSTLKSQITPPYLQTFDSVQCTGWSHGAIQGTDDWQRGVPTGTFLNTPSSSPNVWCTNLNGVTSANSIMYLETPAFNLSDITKEYLISFGHQYKTFSYHGGNIEYSINNSATWQLLNGTAAQKINWYNNSSCSGLGGQPSWSLNNYFNFTYSCHSLISLQGQSNVRFRFKYGGLTTPQEGWMIDNFCIIENIQNIIATQGVTYNATKNYPTFVVSSSLIYNGLVSTPFTNSTNYYFSTDNIFDPGDILIGNKTAAINSSVPTWSIVLPMVPNLNVGDYYIFFKHDFNNNLVEGNENDNTSYSILHIDSTFNVPEHKEDFEGSVNYWKAFANPLFFKKGLSNIHQIEGTHSEKKSWFIKHPEFNSATPTQYLESPYLDLTAANNNVICFWYKAKSTFTTNPSLTKIEISGNNTSPNYTTSISIPMPRFSNWDCNCQSLSILNGNNNAKLRFAYSDALQFSVFNKI